MYHCWRIWSNVGVFQVVSQIPRRRRRLGVALASEPISAERTFTAAAHCSASSIPQHLDAMATPQSALTSPIPSSAFPQQTCQSPNGDFSSLDFLSFIETDGSTPQPETNGSPHIVHPPPHQNESGPSNVSAHSAGSSSGSRRHSVDSDRPSGRGRARERGTKRRGGAPKSSSRHNAQEVDHQLQVQGLYGMNQGGPEEMEAMMGAGNYGLSGGEGFDAAQAGLLQQQVSSCSFLLVLLTRPARAYPHAVARDIRLLSSSVAISHNCPNVPQLFGTVTTSAAIRHAGGTSIYPSKQWRWRGPWGSEEMACSGRHGWNPDTR